MSACITRRVLAGLQATAHMHVPGQKQITHITNGHLQLLSDGVGFQGKQVEEQEALRLRLLVLVLSTALGFLSRLLLVVVLVRRLLVVCVQLCCWPILSCTCRCGGCECRGWQVQLQGGATMLQQLRTCEVLQACVWSVTNEHDLQVKSNYASQSLSPCFVHYRRNAREDTPRCTGSTAPHVHITSQPNIHALGAHLAARAAWWRCYPMLCCLPDCCREAADEEQLQSTSCCIQLQA